MEKSRFGTFAVVLTILFAFVLPLLFAVIPVRAESSGDTVFSAQLGQPVAEVGETFWLSIERTTNSSSTGIFTVIVPQDISVPNSSNVACRTGAGCEISGTYPYTGTLTYKLFMKALVTGDYDFVAVFSQPDVATEVVTNTITITPATVEVTFDLSATEVTVGQVVTHTLVLTPTNGPIPDLSFHFGIMSEVYTVGELHAWELDAANSDGGGCVNWPSLAGLGYVACHLTNVFGPVTLTVPYEMLTDGWLDAMIAVDFGTSSGPWPVDPAYRDICRVTIAEVTLQFLFLPYAHK